ncbi:MAG: hypothetical protein ACRCS4_09995 [Flavobacterium sp.]
MNGAVITECEVKTDDDLVEKIIRNCGLTDSKELERFRRKFKEINLESNKKNSIDVYDEINLRGDDGSNKVSAKPYRTSIKQQNEIFKTGLKVERGKHDKRLE